MRGSDFMDEIDCGSFFDQMDDLFECPADSVCGVGSGAGKDFQTIWSYTSSDAFPVPDTILSGNSASHLSAELSVPYEDIVQLEWLSNFVEDSFSGRGMTMSKENNSPINNNESSHNQFQTCSPVSVLESSSSSSTSTSSCSRGGKTVPTIRPTQQGPQRARSKRPRPATFNPRPAIQFISSAYLTENPHQPFPVPVLSSESGNFADAESYTSTKIVVVNKIPKAAAGGEHKKRKKTKPLLPFAADKNQDQNPTPQAAANAAVRKCLHCEITKTPQWRAGPTGPKTLCNACGVRYKSGRLFPEYRPAASPTFVASLHSNSHKKVVEMRSVGDVERSAALALTVATPEPQVLIPNSNPLLDLQSNCAPSQAKPSPA